MRLLICFFITMVATLSLGSQALADVLREELLIENEVESFETDIMQEEMAANAEEQERLAREKNQIENEITHFQTKQDGLKDQLERSRKSLAEVKQVHYDRGVKLDELKSKHQQTMQEHQALMGELDSAKQILLDQRREIEKYKAEILEKKEQRKFLLRRKERAKQSFDTQAAYLEKLKNYNMKLASENRKIEDVVIRAEAKAQRMVAGRPGN